MSVYFLKENEDDHYPEEGWYFLDECEQFVGPYYTKKDCIDALNVYEP